MDGRKIKKLISELILKVKKTDEQSLTISLFF